MHLQNDIMDVKKNHRTQEIIHKRYSNSESESKYFITDTSGSGKIYFPFQLSLRGQWLTIDTSCLNILSNVYTIWL